MLKAAGATEVHRALGVAHGESGRASTGIDTANQDQLIAANMSLDEIRAYIEADSVGFLSIEGLLECVPEGGPLPGVLHGRVSR